MTSIIAPHRPLPADDRLKAIVKEIQSLQATAILQIAERLAEAREIFRYQRDEGGFAGWVETHLNFSRSTAYNLLSIYERFGGEGIQYLDTFPASILYLLAAPSTPKEAVDEIVHRAQTGESVPVAEVKRTIERTKGRVQPTKKTGREVYPKEPPTASTAMTFEVAAELKDLITKAPGWTGATVGTQAEVNVAIERLRDDDAPGHWLIVAPRERLVVDYRVIQWLLLTAPPPPAVARIEWAFALCDAAEQARCPAWVSERLTGKSHPQRPGMTWPRALPIPQQAPADDIGADSRAENERLRARVEELQAQVRQRDIKIDGLERANRALRAENEELRTRLPPGDPGPVPAFLDRRAAP
jgi:uncharacterized protein UPF0137/DUF3102 family protein